MTNKQTIAFIVIITAVSFAIGWYFYPLFPDMVASHWGINGEVNGYMPKFWGIFLFPFMMGFLSLLLFFLPKIDPLRANVETFRKYYNGVIAGIIVFLFYIYLLTIAWTLGYRFNMGKMIVPPLAFLWFLLGVAMPKMKQNWFMGIRTPWTLASVRVWDETHRVGGKLFQYSAVIALFGLLFPPYSFWFIIIPVIFSSFGIMAYSYVLFRRYGSDKL
jgi:uncharacterized membrane protein